MATRKIGQLTIDLIANLGGFEQGMSKAERRAEDFSKATLSALSKVDSGAGKLANYQRAIDQVEKAFQRYTKSVKGAGDADITEQYEKAIAALKTEANAFKESIDPINQQRAAFAALEKQLDPVPSQLEQVAASQKQVEAAFSRGDINYETYNRLSAVLDKQKAGLDGTRAASKAYSNEMSATAQELNSVLGMYDKTTGALFDLSRAQSVVDDAFNNNNISTEQYQRVTNAIRAQKDELNGVAEAARNAQKAAEDQQRQLAQVRSSLDPQSTGIQRYQSNQQTLDTGRTNGSLSEEDYQKLTKANQDFRKEVDGTNKALREQEQQSKADSAEFDRLVAAVDPAEIQLRNLANLRETLVKGKSQGMFDEDEVVRYTAELDKLEDEINANARQYGNLGTSVKAQRAALRTLPAQFTDIAVSLQAGQHPMTVFLQQGGQIKDVFGGVKPALKATAGYIYDLITPINAAIAGFAGLSVVVYKALAAQQRFAQLSDRTNGYSGSQQQLTGLEGELQSTGSTAATAEQAISSLADTGKYTFSQIQDLAQGAADSIKLGDDNAQAFNDTLSQAAKDPVQALIDLNDKYHDVDAAQIQITQSLVEQGRQSDAVRTAQEAAADEVHKRLQREQNDLFTLQKLWDQYKTRFSNFWNNPNQGVSGYINGVSKSFQGSSENDSSDNRRQWLQQNHDYGLNTEAQDKELAVLKQVKIHQDEVASAQRNASDAAAENAKQIKAQNAALEGSLSPLQRADRKEKDIQQRRQQYLDKMKRLGQQPDARVLSGFDDETSQAQAQANDALNGIGSKHKSSGSSSNRAAEQQNQQLIAARRGLSSLLQPYDQVSQAQTKYEGQLSQINDALKKGQINELEATVARTKAAAQYDRAREAVKSLNDQLEAYQKNLDRQADTARQGISDQVASYSQGSTENQRSQQIQGIRRQGDQDVAQLDSQRSNTSDPRQQALLEGQIKLRQKQTDKLVAIQEDGYAKIDAARQSWENGAEQGWANIQDSVKDVSKSMSSTITGAFDNMNDSLANFVATGKLSFSDLTTTMASDLAKLAIQAGENQIISALFGGSQISSGGLGGAALAVGQSVFHFADGGQVKGPGTGRSDSIPAMLSNGEFVVNAQAAQANLPALHAMNSHRYADGGQIMSGGRIASGASSSRRVGQTGQGDINLNVTVQADSSMSAQDARKQGNQIGQGIAAAVANQQIQKSLRPGGDIYNFTRGRS